MIRETVSAALFCNTDCIHICNRAEYIYKQYKTNNQDIYLEKFDVLYILINEYIC